MATTQLLENYSVLVCGREPKNAVGTYCGSTDDLMGNEWNVAMHDICHDGMSPLQEETVLCEITSQRCYTKMC